MDTPRVNVTLRQPCADLRGADWQPSNADAVLLEHDEAALLERFGELREVRQQQRDDELSAMKGKAAQQRSDGHGCRRDASRKPKSMSAESGCVVLQRLEQDLLVQRTLQAVLPYMHRIVPAFRSSSATLVDSIMSTRSFTSRAISAAAHAL